MQKADKRSLVKIHIPAVPARSGTGFLGTQIHSSKCMIAVLFSPSRPLLKQELQSLIFQTSCNSHAYHIFITSFSTGLSWPDSGSGQKHFSVTLLIPKTWHCTGGDSMVDFSSKYLLLWSYKTLRNVCTTIVLISLLSQSRFAFLLLKNFIKQSGGGVRRVCMQIKIFPKKTFFSSALE